MRRDQIILRCPRCEADVDVLFWEPVNAVTGEVRGGFYTATSSCGTVVELGEVATDGQRLITELPERLATLLADRCPRWPTEPAQRARSC